MDRPLSSSPVLLRILFLTLTVFLLDQGSKLLAVHLLSGISTLAVLPGLFHLTLLRNSGVAFGLFSEYSLPVAVATVSVVIAVLWSTFQKVESRGACWIWSVGLILGGAVGNLVDRIRVGGVIDFLDFRIWPVFNVADSCITIGTFLMAWSLLCRAREKGEKGKEGEKG